MAKPGNSITEAEVEKLRSVGLSSGKKENNPYLILKVQGDGIWADPKWNAKIYRGKKGFTVATNDMRTLHAILSGKKMVRKDKRYEVMIDDSGVGFPLGGILMGMCLTDTVRSDTVCRFKEVSVRFFQSPLFEQKKYLDEAARVTLELLQESNVPKKDANITICTGHVNTMAKESLRKEGFDTQVGEIKDPLQSALEEEHRMYIQSKFGFDLYFDPKAEGKGKASGLFDRVVQWIREENQYGQAKTGWDFFKKKL